MNVKQKIVNGLDMLRLYWKTPPYGRYMNFKEIVSLSVGSMGVKFVTYCVQNMILYVGNTLIGNTIGISPAKLYLIYVIAIASGFPLTTLRANLVDSARSKKGKYRPYILTMGIPTALLAIGFCWMPYDSMVEWQKCVVVLLFNIAFQFFYNFFLDANDSLLNVLSPNTIERSDVCSIKTIVDSFAPTIANAILPVLARLITGENKLYDLRVMRIVYPPFIILGLLMSILIYVNTEEKIVQAKTHVHTMRFIDALRAVARNKYFWIISLAGWLGFLENSFANIIGWLYNYQNACEAGQYSLITLISGNASLWPMMFAPFLIRAIGKRNMLVFSNLLNIMFILVMLPIINYGDMSKIIWLLLVCVFVNTMATQLGHILTPSLNADIRDYQQYITGERIDGMFVAVGLIGSIVTMITSSVLPSIQEHYGLNESVAASLGYSNVYDVLYNTDYFRSICSVMVVASVIGAALNVLPFFFYDLTELRQKAMVQVLKIRAMFEDFGNNVLNDAALVETIEIIEEAKSYVDRTPHVLNKKEVKAAKKDGKDAYKQAKAAYKEKKSDNEKIEIAQFVMREMNRFESAQGKADVAVAKQLVSAGLNGFTGVDVGSLADAKKLPKKTQEEKEIRNAAIEQVRGVAVAKKLIAKYYPDGISEFDMDSYEKLFVLEAEKDTEIKAAIAALKQAREANDSALASAKKEELASLKRVRSEIKAEIKKAEKQYSLYNRAAKPYLAAKKLLIQQENYRHYDEIYAQYEESKARVEKEYADRLAKDAAEKAASEEYAAKLKAEKAAKKKK